MHTISKPQTAKPSTEQLSYYFRNSIHPSSQINRPVSDETFAIMHFLTGKATYPSNFNEEEEEEEDPADDFFNYEVPSNQRRVQTQPQTASPPEEECIIPASCCAAFNRSDLRRRR